MGPRASRTAAPTPPGNGHKCKRLGPGRPAPWEAGGAGSTCVFTGRPGAPETQGRGEGPPFRADETPSVPSAGLITAGGAAGEAGFGRRKSPEGALRGRARGAARRQAATARPAGPGEGARSARRALPLRAGRAAGGWVLAALRAALGGPHRSAPPAPPAP